MCPTLPKPDLESLRERFTAVSTAKADSSSAPTPDQVDALGPAFTCVEETGYLHRLSDKEMCALLKIPQSKYRTHAYNIATVQNLPIEMRQTFARFYAESVGLKTPKAKAVSDVIRAAAKDAIVRLLEVLTEVR